MPAERKYAKYVIEHTPAPPRFPRPADPVGEGRTNVLYVNNGLDGALPEATYFDVGLISKPMRMAFEQHAHAFDEYVSFIGTNAAKPYDLDGVVEFWIEDEKYILTKSCAIFVPKGVYHCPFVFHEVNSPIVFLSTAPTTHNPDPRPPIDPPHAGFGEL